MLRYVSALLIVAATVLAAPAYAADKLLTVTGDATVAVAPDAAVIRIGVTSSAKTAREASDANAKQMTSVMAAIKEAGIADRDVQTSRLSLQPQYDPNKSGTARLLGFQVTNQLTIKIRDIDKMPSILDRVIDAFETRRGEMTAAIGTASPPSVAAAAVPHDFDAYVFETFDAEHGGFGLAPKFPLTSPLDLALARYRQDENPAMARIVGCFRSPFL